VIASELLRRDKTVVGISSLGVARGRGLLVTHALGSCVGVSVFDPAIRVGGLLHAMLPAEVRGGATPREAMFVKTGLPLLLRECQAHGCDLRRVQISVAGGASMLRTGSLFQTGARNLAEVRRVLEEHGLRVCGHAVGGAESRTMVLDLETGQVTIITPAGEQQL
jgi:chemotaxis protein CheD